MSSKDRTRPYDIFISYSHGDAQWVRDNLLPRLKEAGFKICIDSDSFDVGVAAIINMENAVALSRHTILVLTPAWVQSQWTTFEGLLIQHSDPGGVERRTLPILVQSCDVPDRIAILTRLDLTGEANIENEFARLIDAIKGVRRLSNLNQGAGDNPPGGALKGPAYSIQSIPRPPDTGFIRRKGRGGFDIIEKLKEELAPEKRLLVVLRGEGGVGKTTIAAEIARRMSSDSGKRIIWTSADGREDFSLSTLLDEIATQLGNADLRIQALDIKKETVRSLIDSTEGPMLVVLDNFETISADEQKRCAEWIAGVPCPALITTRQKVNVGRNIAIDAMASDEAHEYLERLIEQAQNPRSFEGLDKGLIVEASDAKPFVMQWVVAQIDLAQHPRDVLDELAHGEGDAAERVFDRSFNLPQLGDDGRAALLALSLFVPSASRSALADVAGFGGDAKRLKEAIVRLAALSLVETTAGGERLMIKGLTREFAKARLYKVEGACKFRHQFVDYFSRYAKQHDKKTPDDFDCLKEEKDNLLNAMDVALEMEDEECVMKVVHILGSINAFWDLCGYWDEAIKYNHRLAQATHLVTDDLTTAIFSHRVGIFQWRRGLYNEAQRANEQALAIYRKLEKERNVAVALHNLAMIARDLRDLAKAKQLFNECLEIEKKLDSRDGIASTLHEMGLIAQDQTDLIEARRLYNESLEIEEQLGNQRGIAITLHQLGMIAQNQGELDEARRLYYESLEIKKKIGDQGGIAITLHQLGRLAEDEGDKAEAAKLFLEALTIFEKLGSPKADVARQSLNRAVGEE